MIVFINNKNQIKDVGTTEDKTLKAVEVKGVMFDGWRVSRILCYAVQLDADGKVGGCYPYIDSRIIDELEKLDKEKQEQLDECVETDYEIEDAICSNYEEQSEKNGEIEDALCEIYEMLG